MGDEIEQESVQNSRIFYEAFLPGAVTRLRNQALVWVEGIADNADAIDGLDRMQLVDAVRKYLADWSVAGGMLDPLMQEAAEKNEFRIQSPASIYVTPFPLVLCCIACGALENHDKAWRSHDQILATTHARVPSRKGKPSIHCVRQGCGGRMEQVPFVVAHRCGHLSPMTIPPKQRSAGALGLRHNRGPYNQNTLFDLGSNTNLSTAWADNCPSCTASNLSAGLSTKQKGTSASGGEAFFPQTIQFVALSKKPGELISNIQMELARLPLGELTGRAKDLAEGIGHGLLGGVDSAGLQAHLLEILEGGEVKAQDFAAIEKEREKLEKEIVQLEALMATMDLSSALQAAKDRLSKLISKMGAAEGTFSQVRQHIDQDAVLLSLLGQRRTMEAVLLRHDVDAQSIDRSIEQASDEVLKLSRAQDWAQIQNIYGIQDITHITDLKVVLTAVGFTREKREPENLPDEIAVKLNPFEDRNNSAANGKAMLYVLSAQTEALWIKLDPIKVLQWCVNHGGWEAPPEGVLLSRAAAQGYLLSNSPALTCAPGVVLELTKTQGVSRAAPFHLLHTISHVLLLTARRHSGYDSLSLTEYLFPMDLSFLIYVTSVQNYTAGGLLTLFQHYLRHWLEDASLHAYNCAFDPICSDVGSACPGCIQIPRGCETFNSDLSRAYLHGGYVDKDQSLMASKGYWQQ